MPFVPARELKMKIEALIERTFRESGCAVFLPEQFVDEGIGSETEVLHVLRQLEGEGELRAYASVRCAAGHDFGGGAPHELAQALPRECTLLDCETHEWPEAERLADENLPRVIVRYAMSKRWRADVETDGQKKTPPSGFS
jgi:hypothetical protein